MLSRDNSLYFFMFLELVYLVIAICSTLFESKLIIWAGYILAGAKYSISALTSIDIITYNSFYEGLGSNVEADTSSGMEIGFIALLHLAKSLNLPIALVHSSLVVFFLFATNRFFCYFLPKNEANLLTLMFGFFPLGGELCIYLLRQLASTSLVILGLSFLLEKRKIFGLLVFTGSLFFHVSSVIYTPFFLVGFIEKKSLKIVGLVVFYLLIILFFFIPPDLLMSTLSTSASDSSYIEKYDKYTTNFDERTEGSVGAFNMIIIGYFIWCLRKAYKYAESNQILNYCYSSILITITYLVCELNHVIWMSSRIKFISTMLLVSSSIILTTKFVFKNQTKASFLWIMALMFLFSIYFVQLGHNQHNLYVI
jgi:EpsG family